MLIRQFFSLFFLLIFSVSAWELKKEEDGIEVSVRPYPGSSVKEFRATVEIDSDFDTVLKKILDASSYPTWLEFCKEAKVVEKINEKSFVAYSVNKLPFPLNNRDVVTTSKFEKGKDNAKIDFEATPDKLPMTEGLVRITVLKGFWILKTTAPNKTAVTYQVHTEPGGNVPAWAVNSAIVDHPFHTLRKLRLQTEKK